MSKHKVLDYLRSTDFNKITVKMHKKDKIENVSLEDYIKANIFISYADLIFENKEYSFDIQGNKLLLFGTRHNLLALYDLKSQSWESK